MATKTYVVVKTEFDGIHCWANCPHEEVAFLRSPHRHKFYVVVKVPVSHDDRDIEFFMLKDAVHTSILFQFDEYSFGDIHMLGSQSCEMMAGSIISLLAKQYPEVNEIFCSVFEDNENGSEIVWTKEI